MTYYAVKITETGSPLFRSEYSRFNTERLTFETKEAALAFLAERYKGHKKSRMYVDGKDGKPEPVGWIYGFKNADYSHAPVDSWMQQDWVELREVNESQLDF